MSDDDKMALWPRELIPNATEAERAMAWECLDDYIRILVQIAER